MAVIPTIDVMPMTTPSTVSPDRILFERIVSNAIAMTSVKRAARMLISLAACSPQRTQRTRRCERVVPSFFPQRLDRIQPRRACGGVQPEEQSDDGRDADAEGDGPDLD